MRGSVDWPMKRFDEGYSYSSSAEMRNWSRSASHQTLRTLGLQHTWQSSTYDWRLPAEGSTEVSFHSPQEAHWKPEVIEWISRTGYCRWNRRYTAGAP